MQYIYTYTGYTKYAGYIKVEKMMGLDHDIYLQC